MPERSSLMISCWSWPLKVSLSHWALASYLASSSARRASLFRPWTSFLIPPLAWGVVMASLYWVRAGSSIRVSRITPYRFFSMSLIAKYLRRCCKNTSTGEVIRSNPLKVGGVWNMISVLRLSG